MDDSYDAIMREAPIGIELVLETEGPIELSDFVGQFTALASQYERYIKENHPDLSGEARVFVREVRPGSILADLLPWTLAVIASMDRLLIVEQFVRTYGGRLLAYRRPGNRDDNATKSDLRDFMDGVRAIANDIKGKATIRAVNWEDGKRDIRASVEITTDDARKIADGVESHKQELDRITHADFERVLMTFKRSDIGDVTVGKKSGERVVIEDVLEKDLPLVYGSDLAEQRIKHEIRNSDENIYHKGLVVDVNVQRRGGKPVAYAVTNVHQIIDLSDD